LAASCEGKPAGVAGPPTHPSLENVNRDPPTRQQGSSSRARRPTGHVDREPSTRWKFNASRAGVGLKLG
jgi:hypothetical protein